MPVMEKTPAGEFWISPAMEPRVIAEASSWLVLYKPPRMHTAPLRPCEENTLLAWAALRFPEVLKIKGRKEIEGGLVHRLDYDTQGLVLCARTDAAIKALLNQQEAGEVIKEYEAASACLSTDMPPGFPPLPAGRVTPNCVRNHVTDCTPTRDTRFHSGNPLAVIESAFRPFGKGRKAIRPLTAESCYGTKTFCKKDLYRTKILSCAEMGEKCFFRLRICKGFRHQIRCHLAWIGRPILNDSLYGNFEGGTVSATGKETVDLTGRGFLALLACSIEFADPDTGKAVFVNSDDSPGGKL